MNWAVNPEAASALEKTAQDIDTLLIPLSELNNSQQYVQKIHNIIRAGNSSWIPSRVHWTYVKELDQLINELELASEQDSCETEHEQIYDKPNQSIPYEYRTSPISQTKLAQYWGGDMTRKKLREMIDTGHLNMDRMTNHKFRFDMRQLPPHVKNRLSGGYSI
ncbi:hypothetical protein ACFLZ8_03425 [Planctomycetota bacterium]